MINKEIEIVIETQGVGRLFGHSVALDKIDLNIPRGCIYGLLGCNGAGKSTVLKILAGIIKPCSGKVRVLGGNPFTFDYIRRREIGYVSQAQILPANFKVSDILRFTSSLYPKWDHDLVERLLERFTIDKCRVVATLSPGAQRGLSITLALAQCPEVLILDEPTSGLDAVVRGELTEEVIKAARVRAVTVVIASHYLSDIEKVADYVGIMNKGRIVVEDAISELKASVKKIRFYSFSSDSTKLSWRDAISIKRSGAEITVIARIRDDSVVRRISREFGAEFEIKDVSLEEIFVGLQRKT